MEAKHTPGPWGVNGSHIGPNPDNPMTFCGVASVAGWGPERDADVALISTAPELLAALVQTVQCLSDIANAGPDDRWGWDWESVISEAHEIIAKAKGAK